MARLLLRSMLTLVLVCTAIGCGSSGNEKGTAPMPKSGPTGSSPGELAPVAPQTKN
jgi:hypothetical protein